MPLIEQQICEFVERTGQDSTNLQALIQFSTIERAQKVAKNLYLNHGFNENCTITINSCCLPDLNFQNSSSSYNYHFSRKRQTSLNELNSNSMTINLDNNKIEKNNKESLKKKKKSLPKEYEFEKDKEKEKEKETEKETEKEKEKGKEKEKEKDKEKVESKSVLPNEFLQALKEQQEQIQQLQTQLLQIKKDKEPFKKSEHKPKPTSKESSTRFNIKVQKQTKQPQNNDVKKPEIKTLSTNQISKTNVQKSKILLVTNLTDNFTNCKSLFTLFSCYGRVEKIKILYKRRGSALIQMSSIIYSGLAKKNLENEIVFGRKMRIAYSHIPEIEIRLNNNNVNTNTNPNTNQNQNQNAPLTMDFRNTNLHRFPISFDNSKKRIIIPSPVLFVSNIPEFFTDSYYQREVKFTENNLISFWRQYGQVINYYSFLKNNQKKALIEMASKESAINTLISLHNFTIGNRQLYISFSEKQKILSTHPKNK
ncbi:heterogeneous nuclear ribonucleoprotein l2 [Anaeramoeba flamelloides]|uniref:Heterogeneous nuclear ribonucleoprotein l2 n=1 Tax=Anaeramoeba flamelloides TaxID=1746091 RepID=A0ABQ8XE64_9EUKA|nr:heterogeneous nuclear ribonucleoprotein l2 [Anaeramoeba flamelloides]